MSKGGHRHGCYRHAPRDLQEPRRWRSLFGLSERSNIREFALAERTSLVSVKYCSALGTGRFAGVSPRSTAEKLRSAGSPDATTAERTVPGRILLVFALGRRPRPSRTSAAPRCALPRAARRRSFQPRRPMPARLPWLFAPGHRPSGSCLRPGGVHNLPTWRRIVETAGATARTR